MNDELQTPSARRLLLTGAVTAAAAAAILVLVVLPAEYQIDPTGLGRRIGLDRLAAVAGEGPPLAAADLTSSQDEAFRTEEVSLELRPGEEMELKIAMDEGDTVVYAWELDRGAIYSDFHAEPYGEPEGGSIRYEEADGTSSAYGSLNAPFAGHHGWYWRNPNEFPVRVRLEVAGYFSVIKERRR